MSGRHASLWVTVPGARTFADETKYSKLVETLLEGLEVHEDAQFSFYSTDKGAVEVRVTAPTWHTINITRQKVVNYLRGKGEVVLEQQPRVHVAMPRRAANSQTAVFRVTVTGPKSMEVVLLLDRLQSLPGVRMEELADG